MNEDKLIAEIVTDCEWVAELNGVGVGVVSVESLPTVIAKVRQQIGDELVKSANSAYEPDETWYWNYARLMQVINEVCGNG